MRIIKFILMITIANQIIPMEIDSPHISVQTELWEILLSYQTHNNYLLTRNKIAELIKAGADINAPRGNRHKRHLDPLPYDSPPPYTPVEWAIHGQYFDVYELLLDNGAIIHPNLNFTKTPRITYITIKHLIRRIVIPYRFAIRTLLMCLNRMDNTDGAIREVVRQGKVLLRPHFLSIIEAECKDTLKPYEDKHLLYYYIHGHNIFSTEAIRRFLDLFI